MYNVLVLIKILFLLFSIKYVYSQSHFNRITNGTIVNKSDYYRGCNLIDFNNDQYLDIFLSNFHGNNYLYKNVGNFVFELVNHDTLNHVNFLHEGGTWGDYDNDGNIDFFVSDRWLGNNLLYHNNGDGTFSRILHGDIINVGEGPTDACWGDYDNDGFIDLFVATATNWQNNFLFHNNGDGSFTRITEGDIVIDQAESRTGCWVDYDNDGDLDMYVANSGNNNDNFFYKNNGLGEFTKITGLNIVQVGEHTQSCSWGDYDNDGDLDLFLANGTYNHAKRNYLFRNDGNDSFVQVNPGTLGSINSYSTGSCWGDYDNDGDLDLFVANSWGFDCDGINFLYENVNDTLFEKINDYNIQINEGESLGSAWGDFDNDGNLDLFVSNWNGTNFLFQNTGNQNHWINIKCIGKVSNSSAIGAKIKLKAFINNRSVWQLQEISSKSGRTGQNSLNAEFGLGNATIIDSIIVKWPSGINSILTNVDVDQFVSITEEFPIGTLNINFTADDSCNILPATVQFFDKSISNPPIATWQWDFNNDGIIDSNEKNPRWTFTNTGSFTIKLSVNNGIVSDSLVREKYLHFPLFIKIENNSISNDGGRSTGASWIDYDNDNDLDLFVSNIEGGNYLYQNNLESQAFSRISDPISNISRDTYSAVWGDYDNDNYLDVFIANANGNNQIYYNNGNGSFQQITQGEIVNDGGTSSDACWGDFNNDGYIDLFVSNRNINESNFLYINNTNGTFNKILNGEIVTDRGYSEGCSWIDYNKDGFLDLFVTNNNHYDENFLYRNEGGTGKFSKITNLNIISDNGNSRNCNWIDYNNDGNLDLFIVAGYRDRNRLYMGTNDSSFIRIDSSLITENESPSVSSNWGDFDNDGDIDLLIVTRNDHWVNELYSNNGFGNFTQIRDNELANNELMSTGSCWGDYDLDGDLDIFVSNTTNVDFPSNYLYINNGNNNNWINIECKGTSSNNSAIGTIVKVQTEINNSKIWQTRLISAPSGGYTQNSLNVEYGLGKSEFINSLIIEWPSGYQEFYANIGANQFLSAVEGVGIFNKNGTKISNIIISDTPILLHNFPNPFNHTTTIRYIIPKRKSITLEVFDITGKLIKILIENEMHELGSYDITWNGENRNGMQVSSGVYLYRLKTNKGVKSYKMILLK